MQQYLKKLATNLKSPNDKVPSKTLKWWLRPIKKPTINLLESTFAHNNKLQLTIAKCSPSKISWKRWGWMQTLTFKSRTQSVQHQHATYCMQQLKLHYTTTIKNNNSDSCIHNFTMELVSTRVRLYKLDFQTATGNYCYTHSS